MMAFKDFIHFGVTFFPTTLYAEFMYLFFKVKFY